jgi:hypothetical protein
MMTTSASNHDHYAEHAPGEPGLRRSLAIRRTAAMTGLLGLALLAAGCGGSKGPDIAGPGSSKAQALAYSRCMRSHGVSDFPDPTTPAGGGVAFQVNGGPGSDLNQSNPTFRATSDACRGLLPGGQQSATIPAPNLAAELTWVRCLRSRGVPSFPDPNNQGAFDSSKFDANSPAFRSASSACKSLQPTGAVSAVPGRG